MIITFYHSKNLKNVTFKQLPTEKKKDAEVAVVFLFEK